MGAAFRCKLGYLPSISDEQIIGQLSVAQSRFAQSLGSKTQSWIGEIAVLRFAATELNRAIDDSTDWTLLLEYQIPLRNRWPDAILIARDTLFVIEFKVGETQYRSPDLWQVRSYALDLKDFHSASQHARVVPILVATAAPDPELQADFPVCGRIGARRTGAPGQREDAL